jgi:hypothetical protein
MTKLDPTPADIDIHLLDRIKAIPDIDSAKTDGFTADLRLSVSTRRHDDGLWTTTTTTTSDGRRRRSPATHAPTTAPAMCTAPYTGQNVVPGGQNTAAGTAVAFSCKEDVTGKNTKYPLTGKVECYGTGKWRPYSSGSTTDVQNWGCGATDDCWELPYFKITAAGTKIIKPEATGAGFKADTVSKGSVAAPFPSVPKDTFWCANSFECCTTGTHVLLKDKTPTNKANILEANLPKCAATGGDYVASTLPANDNDASAWKFLCGTVVR